MSKRKKTKPPDPATTPEAEQAAYQAAADQLAAEAAADQPVAEADAAAEAPPDRQADPLDQLRAKLQVAEDRVLRSQAELENYRKRATRQMQEERRYANLPLMRDVLPVLDNLDRAIEAAETTHDAAGLLDGVKIVAQQLVGVLQKHHCAEIDALHEPFDPHRHEAIMQQPSEEHAANTVISVTQTGFQLHDRVVRHSQVIVSGEK